MTKISLKIYNRFVKGGRLEAWLLRKGFKPHYSNVTHLLLGLAIATTTSVASFAFIGVWLALALGFVCAWTGGYLKEVYDKKFRKRFNPSYVPVFDKLDFLATGFGGTIYCILASLIFITYLLI